MSIRPALLLIPLLLCYQPAAMASSMADWIDSVSLTIGVDDNSNDTDVYRIGLQNDWERDWFNGGAWFLSGQWDFEFGYFESSVNGSDDDLFALSVTPIFRYQRDAELSSGVTPFVDAGLGAHLLSETSLGRQKLSTAFQFGSLLGLGVGFGRHGQYELSYRYQHISNADIKPPNDGIELHLLRLGVHYR